MKLWKVLVLALLLGGGVAIVAQQLRYGELVERADAQADTLQLMTERADSLAQVALARAVELEGVREQARQDSAQAAQERRRLQLQVVEARREGERIEGALRARLDSTSSALLDSLLVSHAEEVAGLEAERDVLVEELDGARQLERATAAALADMRSALEECRCGLEQAQVTVAAYQEATQSRGILNEAWDVITSKPALVLIGTGVAIWLGRELLDDDRGSGGQKDYPGGW